MKIMHVFNIAGVPQNISKYQRREGFIADVYTRREVERFGIADSEPEIVKILNMGPKRFSLYVLYKAKNYDVIHVHSFDKIIPLLKKIFRDNKKIVLTYHGSDIRNKWDKKKRFWEKADLVTVATKDLLENAPKKIIYVPNPVDTDRFNSKIKKENMYKNENTALFILNKNIPHSLEWAKKQAQKYGLKLEILDREKTFISYEELPFFLSSFSLFIDRLDIPSLSKTALECLALGVPVINWEGKIISELPTDHMPQIVAKKWIKLYQEI